MMRIDDFGRWREQRAIAGERRLQRLRLDRGQKAEILDAIRPRPCFDRSELARLGPVSGDDELPAVFMRHAVIGTELIKRTLSGDAEARHQAVLRIVDAGVNDLAVARGNAGADRLRCFENDHLAALDRAVAQGALAKPKVWDDPLLRILLERGASHEQNYVEHLTGVGLDVIRINDVEVTNGAAAETLATMTANAAFIYSDEVTV